MCTVTFVTNDHGFYLTSSRDEQYDRATALPKAHCFEGQTLFYPKDENKGGTWISINKSGRAACLLNGAFMKHERKGHYSKSRGLVLLDSFRYNSIIEFADKEDFKKVEPFTLLLMDFPFGRLNKFYELRWDGQKKHFIALNTEQPQIWSSATLYSPDTQKKRKLLFENWLRNSDSKNPKEVFDFHNTKHGLSPSEDLIMTGENKLRTLSVSQIQVQHEQINFTHLDLNENRSISKNIFYETGFFA